MANPMAALDDFKFTTNKMSGSGSLFDLDKLNDVCKNVVSRMTAEQVYEYVAKWSEEYDPELYNLISRDPQYMIDILSIGRGGKKPRKDFGKWSEVKDYVSFFFDELFCPDYTQMPAHLSQEVINQILTDYVQIYDEADDSSTWFDKLKVMCPSYGFTADMKAYRKDPSAFAGNVGDLSMVLRVAVCGRSQAPDLHTVMQLLGKETVLARLEKAKQ